MTARSKRRKIEKPAEPPANKGWISPKRGLRAVAVVSILLALWTGWQFSHFSGPLESIMWGVIFGASIWLVAGIAYLVNRWLRRG